MGRKLGFTSLFFRVREPTTSSWPWPSCKQPRTHSFRDDGVFKTVNSVYFDTTESWFSNSSEESESFSTASEESGGDAAEAVIRGLRSERLFFEPGDTSSILEVGKPEGSVFKESVVMAMESEDPYGDFRASMEEMVVVNGLTEWGSLEEMLVWYLRVNEKKTHGLIVGAFVDLVVELAAAPPASPSSSSSAFFEIEEVKDEEDSSSPSSSSSS